MYYLAALFPPVERLRVPVSRDQLMLLMAAITELFLGIDIYLAHLINGQIKPAEWIPIIFGLVAGVLLLLAGLIAFRNRPLATIMANIVFVGSIIVGLMGAYFHLVRANLIAGSAPAGEAVGLLIWAPPFLGPLFFTLNGVLGISAAWMEDPTDSGRLRLLGGRTVQMPYSKTRAYFLIIAIGILATVISSVLDHARSQFENPWVWIPTIGGIFACVVTVVMGVLERPSREDIAVYVATMILMAVIGVVGFLLHINTNLVSQNNIVIERFIRGSPLLGPLVFANWGLLGLIVLLDPAEKTD